MITAKVIADSTATHGKDITTFVLEYPKFIHAEFMTHRLFSRNASSSRAIPVQKQIDRVMNDPAMPVFWGKNQAGMQAAEELDPVKRDAAEVLWKTGRDTIVSFVKDLHELGLHKQLANRLLEPWMHIAVVVTATEWGNWYNLRYHKMAQPEIQVLAKAMWEAKQASKPELLVPGQWHLPFVHNHEKAIYNEATLLKMSVARCARVSYNNHDGLTPPIQEDLALYDRLVGGMPKHASPAEHQATPMREADGQSGNFFGWRQYRKTLTDEYLPEFKGPTP